MFSNNVGRGGFFLPLVYQKDQTLIKQKLEKADIDYAELTRWTFPDEFLCFIMETRLLKFVDDTYPNPRIKNEVPIWFLITCQFLLRLYQTGKYQNLRYLLNAGSILTRFGFNVGSKNIGFNDKNKYQRKTAIHDDTVSIYVRSQ